MLQIETKSLWTQIEQELRSRLPRHIYTSYVAVAKCRHDGGSRLELRFPDNFSKEGFEQKCLTTLRQVSASVVGQEIEIYCQVDLDGAHSQEISVPVELAPLPTPFENKYSFENFIVGPSNRLAHTASEAVSSAPGQVYNPLFIFGGAGVGKTHLLKAIGHRLSIRSTGTKVVYTTCEAFTNDLVRSIRRDRMHEFRQKYRNGCDVLLLDDLQFLSGKVRTQEEFYYTFNFLHDGHKQIVLTSDKSAKGIDQLEDRIRTRLEWGLVADISPPEIETRIAILQSRAAKEHIELPEAVAQYLASHITSNVRELEGSLLRLHVHSTITDHPISLELADRTFGQAKDHTSGELTIDLIANTVAQHFKVRTADLISAKRTKDLSLPRQVCMYLLRKHLVMSYPEIGKSLGDRSHPTVMHAVTKITDLMHSDNELLTSLKAIESSFK